MLSYQDVHFRYSGRPLDGVEGLNLNIAAGEVVLLCGRSGCGKTTLTRLANGLIPHIYHGDLHGRVTLGGDSVANLATYDIARQAGSVFQNPRTQFFNPDTDSEIAFGMENLAFSADQLLRRMEQTVAQLHLNPLLGRNIHQLSGGEKQRIAFASVYAMDPALYVLDEPSANLDDCAMGTLRRLLRILKAQGKTILIAEHRTHDILDLVDRVVYLDQGHVASIYTADEFLRISGRQRRTMGLRAAKLADIPLPVPPPRPENPVLELCEAAVSNGTTPVLQGLSFHASAGEIIAVSGRNGTGKSSLLRALCGLTDLAGGSVRWQGRTMGARQRLAHSYMVMQDVGYQLFAESVRQECILGIHNPDCPLAERVLQELNLWPYRDAHPNTLSGGQKQRLAVAVAMVSDKSILLFDEPTSGLDLDSMNQVAQVLRALAHRGRVIFVATHDYELVCTACTRVLHFADGHLAADLPVNRQNADALRRCFFEERSNP